MNLSINYYKAIDLERIMFSYLKEAKSKFDELKALVNGSLACNGKMTGITYNFEKGEARYTFNTFDYCSSVEEMRKLKYIDADKFKLDKLADQIISKIGARDERQAEG